jgi:FMN-dependent NADH-azoreductase
VRFAGDNFIGIEPEVIVAEGIKIGVEQRDKTLTEALWAASSLRAA